MWTLHTDSGNSLYGGQYAKNIYLGDTRIVTKLNSGKDPTYQEESQKQYYYHSDHLGSASLISDYNGKEIDEETGLYYYGARYLDPKYSLWISADPALGDYIPGVGKATANDIGNLPGMGGAFNHINFNLYHYAGNNPVKYVDPDGRSEEDYSSIKMGGYKLKSSQLFDYMVETVTNCGLMGKEYSTDSNNPYVCTTFVSDVLDLISNSKGDYLPGGQKVIDSILKIDDKFESNGTNPSEGTYIFYFDYGDGTGHTGFVNFDKEGNATILHNGSDGNGNSCVNVRTRDSRDFKTWFTDNNSGTLYYKKLEVDIWIE